MSDRQDKDNLHDGKAAAPVSVDRRTTIKWVAATMLATASAACERQGAERTAPARIADLGDAAPVNGTPYGTDPNLVNPVVPWELTMNEAQRELSTALADMILPADEQGPAASEVGVVDFIDEWISAPYPSQQGDRKKVLSALDWLEAESVSRFNAPFAHAGDTNRAEILDDIAWWGRIKPGMEEAAANFRTFRSLAASAYYASEPGVQAIGYMGNSPMAGPYPGPTPEALAHLEQALAGLGLTLPEQ